MQILLEQTPIFHLDENLTPYCHIFDFTAVKQELVFFSLLLHWKVVFLLHCDSSPPLASPAPFCPVFLLPVVMWNKEKFRKVLNVQKCFLRQKLKMSHKTQRFSSSFY